VVSVTPRKFLEVAIEPGEKVSTVLSVYSGAYFLNRTPEPPKWLIPGLIALAVPIILAAKGGLGKSYLILQALIALATGKPFLGYPAMAPMGAVYFGLEDSLDVVHRRIHAIVRNYQAAGDWSEEDVKNFNRNFHVSEVNWLTPGATGYLPGLMAEVEDILETLASDGVRPGAMVLDTLARFSDGDENKVETLRPVLQACFKIAAHGYTPIVLHHVSKGSEGARTKEKPTLAERMSPEWLRGSTAIHDNFRGVLQMTPILESEAESAGLDPDKARQGGYVVFGATKSNSGQKSDWVFLEQDEAGRWYAHPEGVSILAKIRGSKAVAKLNKQIGVLADLHAASRFGNAPDLDALAGKHCPDSANPKTALKQVIYNLRNAGLLQRDSYLLTVTGAQRLVTARGGTNV